MIVLSNLKFWIQGEDYLVKDEMQAYLAHQINYFLEQEFGIECIYKVYKTEDVNNEIGIKKDQVSQGKRGDRTKRGTGPIVT